MPRVHGKTCPQCGAPCAFVGSVRISDVDGRWNADAQRYRCLDNHLIFVADAEMIEALEAPSEE